MIKYNENGDVVATDGSHELLLLAKTINCPVPQLSMEHEFYHNDGEWSVLPKSLIGRNIEQYMKYNMGMTHHVILSPSPCSVYLMEMSTHKDGKFYKIGKSNSIPARKAAYAMKGVDSKVIATIDTFETCASHIEMVALLAVIDETTHFVPKRKFGGSVRECFKMNAHSINKVNDIFGTTF